MISIKYNSGRMEIIMTRKEALRNLLITIFGGVTVGISDDKIDKAKSIYLNDNYNDTGLRKLRKLFHIAFVQNNPIEIKDKSEKVFDRVTAKTKTVKYLKNRGLTLPSNVSDEDICKIIYEIMSNYILPAIMTNDTNDEKKQAEKVDVTESFLRAINDAHTVKNKSFTKETSSLCEIFKSITSNCNCSSDSKYYPVNIYMDKTVSFMMPYKLFTFSVPFLTTNKMQDLYMYNERLGNCSNNVFYTELIQDHTHNGEQILLQTYPISYFDNMDDLYNLHCWEFKTPINHDENFKKCISHNIIDIFSQFQIECQNQGQKKVNEQFQEEIKPHYEIACDYIEELLKNIIELNHRKDSKIDFDNYKLPEGDDLEDFLKTKAEKLIFDFEILYYFIRSFHGENSISALYSTLQNIVMSVTDFLNEFSDDLSEQFKIFLTHERYKKHIDIIYKKKDSKDLEFLMNMESKSFQEHPEQYKVPENIVDYFLYKKKFVFTSLRNALEKYHNALKKPIKTAND